MRLLSKHLRLTVLISIAVLALAWAPGANAQGNCPGGGSNSPPGNSEIDQYSENVPGPCGDQPVNPPSGGGSDAPSGSVPPGTVDDLNSLGADGQAAAALAEATAPRDGESGGSGAGNGLSVEEATFEGSGTGSEDSPLESIIDVLTGSEEGDGNGLGLLLPLILAGVLIAALAYGLRRRLTE